MVSQRRIAAWLPTPPFTCLVCTIPVSYYDHEPRYDRKDWEKLFKDRRPRRRYIVVPSGEVEATDFPGTTEHHIIDDPEKETPFIVVIATGWKASVPRPVPTDPSKALLTWNVPHNNDWTVNFRPANIQGRDENRKAGRVTGYCVYAHCWLLLDRLLGHGVVQQNLGAFVQVARAFWQKHRKEWHNRSTHFATDKCWLDLDSVDLRKREALPSGGSSKDEHNYAVDDPPSYWRTCVFPPRHRVGNPLRVPAVDDLIKRSILGSHRGQNKRRQHRSSPISQLPLELQLMIIDAIYERPFVRDLVEDMRRFFEAVDWMLPSSYWIRRCRPDLIWEVQDLVDSGKPVDWAALCLGLEELQLNPNWYGESGLNYRRQIVEWMAELKPMFLAEVANRRKGTKGEEADVLQKTDD